jgi:hypothetical protein
MLTTKNIVTHYRDVPSVWIFENYCNLDEDLIGQDVRITSLFNPTELKPSMFIFYNSDAGEYRFKCFSTGLGGSGIDLLVHLKGISYSEAAAKMISDYNTYALKKPGGHLYRRMQHFAKWRVRDFKVRKWNTKDRDYYVQFNIGSAIHERFCVKPLESYELYQAAEDGEPRTMIIRGDYIYGYFTTEGVLYKIYQPMRDDAKFIRIKDHIQGDEQRDGNPFLVIGSSLKDIETIYSFRLRVDLIAPNSENELIDGPTIEKYQNQYDRIVTLLDIDNAGVKAMKAYQEQYGIPYVYLPLEKDVSDSVKKHKPRIVRNLLIPLLDKKLN